MKIHRSGVIRLKDVTNPFTFTGRRYDPETELYYYRARYYDPKLGRFVSRDPIGFEGSEWNLYAYANPGPLRHADPSGMNLATSDGPQSHEGHITWYGNYCGLGNGPSNGQPHPLPIDPVDNACQQHDDCYEANGCKNMWDQRQVCRSCDIEFCRRLRTSPCERWGCGKEFDHCRAYREAAMAVFNCNALIGGR